MGFHPYFRHTIPDNAFGNRNIEAGGHWIGLVFLVFLALIVMWILSGISP